jgi:large subunit ribosomal protein L6
VVAPNKKKLAVVGAVRSHIKNMMTGVTKGFTYKLKIVYAHFPMTVKVTDGEIVVENFGGERMPRKMKVLGEVKVAVSGDDILVKGINLEDVSQVAANIQQGTLIKNKDPRVFLDGIYIYEKGEGI